MNLYFLALVAAAVLAAVVSVKTLRAAERHVDQRTAWRRLERLTDRPAVVTGDKEGL